MTDAQMDSVAPLVDQGRLSPDRRTRVVSSDGDLDLIDLAAGTTCRLTETLIVESNPTFSADGRQVYFVRDNNVFSVALDGGLVRQLTDIRAAGAALAATDLAVGGHGAGGEGGSATARADTGQRGALGRQQRELFAVIRTIAPSRRGCRTI